jgi:hypothetical protein
MVRQQGLDRVKALMAAPPSLEAALSAVKDKVRCQQLLCTSLLCSAVVCSWPVAWMGLRGVMFAAAYFVVAVKT